MRVLPEDEQVRKAVGKGIGQVMRDLYNRQESEPVPELIIRLLGQLHLLERRPALPERRIAIPLRRPGQK
jgi:hypothetical protein